MSSDRSEQRLHDIIENIDSIFDYVKGLDETAYLADRKTMDACERCLMRITEAVIKIGPEQMQQIAPNVPVRSVRGLGNILRHQYDDVDPRYIFTTIQRDLSGLRKACAAALKEAS